MTKYATGFGSAGALTGTEVLQVVRSGADLQAAVSDIVALSPPGYNYLINGDMFVNQRSFAGGALSAGVYGYDRWKAGTGGANISVNTTTYLITHTSGPITQVIESPGLSGITVFVSVEDPSGSISVSLDGVTGTITSGSGRRGVSLTLPSGSTGNVTLILTATGVTYKRVKVERGVIATPWFSLPLALTVLSCQRYYMFITGIRIIGYAGSAGNALGYPLQWSMRATPTASISITSSGNVNTGASSVNASSAYAGYTFIVSSAAGNTDCTFNLTLTAEL